MVDGLTAENVSKNRQPQFSLANCQLLFANYCFMG